MVAPPFDESDARQRTFLERGQQADVARVEHVAALARR